MSPDEKLVYMANQIAGFFRSQGETRAVAGTADHINKFWDPMMRETLLKLAKSPDCKINDIVRKALPGVHHPVHAARR